MRTSLYHPRPRLAAALLVLAGALAQTAQAAALYSAALASNILAIDRQLLALESERRGADTAQLHVFIGSNAAGLRLRKLSLWVDEQPPQVYEYSEPEWEALAAGGLHPALSLPLSAGEHRLQVELYARNVDAGPTDARAVGRADQRLSLVPGNRLIEFSLEQSRLGSSSLVQRDWPSVTATPLSHPWLRAADFWLWADRPYLAARTARRAADLGLEPGLSPEADARLALSLRALAGPGAGINTGSADIERYNAVVTGLNSGDAQALATLSELGEADAAGPAAWALRDRANLVLGYHYLRHGAGTEALERFGRVRSPGPYGNPALLGFGWAFLVTPITSTAPVHEGPGRRPGFVVALDHPPPEGAQARRAALQRALVPWTELIGRDALDPAAQEGSLALAWAMEELEAGGQAHTYYRRAAEALELAHGLLDQALQHVASGGLASAVGDGQDDLRSGWRPWLADLPYREDTGYLKWLLGDESFVGNLDRYRTARQLHAEVRTALQRAAALPAEDGRVAAVSTALLGAQSSAADGERTSRADLDRAALSFLHAHQQRTDRYLAEARYALARIYDSAPEPEIDIPARKPRPAGGAS